MKLARRQAVHWFEICHRCAFLLRFTSTRRTIGAIALNSSASATRLDTLTSFSEQR
jgi:hypothetical protein